jgi:hypothetical protein
MFYKARTPRAVLDAARESGLDAAALARFEKWLPTGRIDRKRQDALEMLEAIAALIAAKTPPLRVDYVLADTAAWQAARRQSDHRIG